MTQVAQARDLPFDGLPVGERTRRRRLPELLEDGPEMFDAEIVFPEQRVDGTQHRLQLARVAAPRVRLQGREDLRWQ